MHIEQVTAGREQSDAPLQTLACSADVPCILSLHILKRHLGTVKHCDCKGMMNDGFSILL
jgi:hypothetical protein